MRVPHLAQGDRIHKINVPRNQCRKRLLGIALGVFPNQRHVVTNHVTGICPPTRKPNTLFYDISDRKLSLSPLVKETTRLRSGTPPLNSKASRSPQRWADCLVPPC